MLTIEAVNHYFQHFYGYGSWDAKYWFVGLEEGSGTKGENPKIFKKKCIKFYKNNSKNEILLDMRLFQEEYYRYYFKQLGESSNPPYIHKTWDMFNKNKFMLNR